MSDDPQAFVAGATGYTGRAVVAELRRRGVAVVAHVRPGSPRLEALRPYFEGLGAAIDTTPWEAEAMAATLSRVAPSWVFGLLGITRAGARAEARRTGVAPSYATVDLGLTALLVDAAVAAGGAPRFVYLSSLGTGPKARGAYLRARWRAEEHVRASGLPYTIARPSIISGGDRDETRRLERAAAVASGGVLAVLGALGARGLRRRYAPQTATQLAVALVDAALDPTCAGRVLDSAALSARRDRVGSGGR